jgi:hypothetical protein
MNSYDLSRNWFNWAFDNPEKISPNHAAIYFFAVEHNNRLGWRKKFGFPSQMAMDAIGIKKHSTYIRYFNDLVDFGFFKLIQKSKNQYSSNIISLVNAIPKKGEALDKAIIKHGAKQTESMGQSKRSIDKPINNKPINEVDALKIYDDFIKEIKEGKHEMAVEQWYMTLKVRPNSLTPILTKNFKTQLITDGKVHKTTNDLKKHFYSYLCKLDSVGKLNEYKI